jgi:hypothetical protein
MRVVVVASSLTGSPYTSRPKLQRRQRAGCRPSTQSRARFAVEEESRVAIARAQTPRRADRIQRRGPRRVMDWFCRADSLR